jgi:MFS family permease
MPAFLQFADLFRSLRSRNFRLFFIGQGLSLIGTWMTIIATGWLVYRLADATDPQRAPFLLGMIGFCGQAPIFVISPFAGVLCDRWNPHRVLVVTQTLSFVQSSVMAALTLSNSISIPEVIGLSIFQGFVNAFDMPARQVFIVQAVEDKADLANAIALNSSVFNGARLLGPSIAGVLIARFGEGVCFATDAVSYLAVLIALLMMSVHYEKKPLTRHVLDELKSGIQYAWESMPIRATLLFAAGLSISYAPLQTLLPIFSVQLTSAKEGAQTYGFLMAASGTGSVFGALYLASRRTVVGLDRIMALTAAMLGGAIVAFAFSQHLAPAALYNLMSGVAMVIAFSAGNTLLQTIVEDDKRGRIMSLYGTAIMGLMAFGNFLAGVLADPKHLGPVKALMVFGGTTLLTGVAFGLSLPAIRKQIHPIFARKGIAPSIAAENP